MTEKFLYFGVSAYFILLAFLVVLFASYFHINLLISLLGIFGCMALYSLGPLFSANLIEKPHYRLLLSLPVAIGFLAGFALLMKPLAGLIASIVALVVLYFSSVEVKKIYGNQVQLDLKIVFERYILTAFFLFSAAAALVLMFFYPEVEGKLIGQAQEQIQNYFDSNFLASFEIFGRQINISAEALGVDEKVTGIVVEQIRKYSIYIVATLSLVTLLGLGTLSRLLWIVVGFCLKALFSLLIKTDYYHIETITVEKQVLTRKAQE